MVGLCDDILAGFDENLCTIVLFLDLSAAFDTIDINILMLIFQNEIGVSGLALEWLKSFLSNRSQRVHINGSFSEYLDAEYGVPQGSILGPICFNVYSRSQGRIFRSCGFSSGAFADDSNAKKTFSLSFQYEVCKFSIDRCMNSIMKWMKKTKLKINPEKTEIGIFHPKHLENNVMVHGTYIQGKCVRFSDLIKNVGVHLDNQLSMKTHVNKVVSHAYKLLKDIGHIRNILSMNNTESLVHSVITRLDYCNSLFINLDTENIAKLQKVQNAASRLVLRMNRENFATPMLRELHLLNIRNRVIFKILLLTYKIVTGKITMNFSLKYKQFNGRPKEFLMLELTHANTVYGKRTLRYAAPRLWNSLPVEIRSAESTESFKTSVKTFLFVTPDFSKKVLNW